MQNFVAMVSDRASRMNDEELTVAIVELESGKRKLRLSGFSPVNPTGRVDLAPIALQVLKRVQKDRKKQLHSL